MVLLATVGDTFADEFRVNDFTIEPGETKTISVELNNPDNTYVAFEFFMALPEGVAIATDGDGYLDVTLNSARSSRHTLEAELSSNGSYHFLCYSNRNNALKGTEGEILSITVTADAALENGVLQGRLFNQKLSDLGENKVVFDDFTFNITVREPAPTAVTIVIPAEGATTYCPTYDLDFSGTTGFKAYVADKYDSGTSTVTMKPVDDALEGTGLYLAGTPGEYTVPVAASENDHGNLLAGTTANVSLSPTLGRRSNLVLDASGSSPVFHAANNGEAVTANSAWLQLTTSIYDGQTVAIAFEETPLLGDINKDGSVTITDVTTLVNMILNH